MVSKNALLSGALRLNSRSRPGAGRSALLAAHRAAHALHGIRCFRVGLLPQLDSAEQAFFVADNPDAFGRFELYMPGVAAPDKHPVVAEGVFQILKRLAQPLVPPLAAL